MREHYPPAAHGALEREGRGLEADYHHLEAQQPEVDLPSLRQLAEAALPRGLEEAALGLLQELRVGQVRAGLLKGGVGERPVHEGEGAVAL